MSDETPPVVDFTPLMQAFGRIEAALAFQIGEKPASLMSSELGVDAGGPDTANKAGDPRTDWKALINGARQLKGGLCDLIAKLQSTCAPSAAADWLLLELVLEPSVASSMKAPVLESISKSNRFAEVALKTAETAYWSASNWTKEMAQSRRETRRRIRKAVTPDLASADSMRDVWMPEQEAPVVSEELGKVAEAGRRYGLPLAKELHTRRMLEGLLRDVAETPKQLSEWAHRDAIRLVAKALDLKSWVKPPKTADAEAERGLRVPLVSEALRSWVVRSAVQRDIKVLRSPASHFDARARDLWAELNVLSWYDKAEWLTNCSVEEQLGLIQFATTPTAKKAFDDLQRSISAALGEAQEVGLEARGKLRSLAQSPDPVGAWAASEMRRLEASDAARAIRLVGAVPAASGEGHSASAMAAIDLGALTELMNRTSLEELLDSHLLACFRSSAGVIALARALPRYRSEVRAREADQLEVLTRSLRERAQRVLHANEALRLEAPWIPPGLLEAGESLRRALDRRADECREQGRRLRILSQASPSLTEPIADDGPSSAPDMEALVQDLAFDPRRSDEETERLRRRALSRLMAAEAGSVESLASNYEGKPPEMWPLIWEAGLRNGWGAVLDATLPLLKANSWAREAWVRSLEAAGPHVSDPGMAAPLSTDSFEALVDELRTMRPSFDSPLEFGGNAMEIEPAASACAQAAATISQAITTWRHQLGV
jgi:hypothetical protein